MDAYGLRNSVLPAALMLLVQGCGVPPGSIPTGEWAGSGLYVDYEVVSAHRPKSDGLQRSKDGEYETRLKIAETRAFGRDALAITIHSKRGELYNVPGDETEIEVILIRLKTLPNDTRLYAVHSAGIDDGLKGEPNKDPHLPADAIAAAVLFPTPKGSVLQLQYYRPSPKNRHCFADTFRFEANRVLKTGRYVSAESSRKLVKVHWVEELRRVR